MDRPAALSRCPGCAEPLESGDLFCGVCGYDLSAVPPPPRENPTAPLGAPPPGEPAPGAAWSPAPEAAPAAGPAPGRAPAAPQGPGHTLADGAALRFDERAAAAPGQTAAGPGQTAATPGQGAAPAPYGEGEGHGGDFELPAPRAQAAAPHPPGVTGGPAPAVPAPGAAPDPRTVEHAAVPAPAAGGRVCVACRGGQVDADGYCENCGHAQPRERDHMELALRAVAAVSDRGLRHHRNEDAFAVASAALADGSPATVAIVCDGVSSATRPDEASQAAAETACASLLAALPRGTHPQTAMHEAIVAAAKAVDALADGGDAAREHDPHRHQNAPACTLVGAVVAGELLVVGWVGDSRAYWVPDDRTAPAARLTEDDSWAAQMVSAGLMGEAEAYADERAHAITGWLGADAYELDPHTAAFKPDRPGVVLVCTDGLWNYAESPGEMARVLPGDAAGEPLHSARVLVGHALDGGGHDNVTVAVVPFTLVSPGAGSA